MIIGATIIHRSSAMYYLQKEWNMHCNWCGGGREVFSLTAMYKNIMYLSGIIYTLSSPDTEYIPRI